MLRICAVFVLVLLPVAAISAVTGVKGVVRVVDADTWDVGGQRVRLFGIDAPEYDQTCKAEPGGVWACGAWATDRVRARYDGKVARCAAIATDRYGRMVARCSVAGQDAGRVLVSEGLAFAYRRYSMDYVADERRASAARRGLHGSRVQSPEQFRATRRATSTPADRACAIKGNISSRGERIFHVPGQENYERTRISTRKGERWFCTPAEARAAGWRQARR